MVVSNRNLPFAKGVYFQRRLLLVLGRVNPSRRIHSPPNHDEDPSLIATSPQYPTQLIAVATALGDPKNHFPKRHKNKLQQKEKPKLQL